MSGLYIRKLLSFKLEKYDKPDDMTKMLQLSGTEYLLGKSPWMSTESWRNNFETGEIEMTAEAGQTSY